MMEREREEKKREKNRLCMDLWIHIGFWDISLILPWLPSNIGAFSLK